MEEGIIRELSRLKSLPMVDRITELERKFLLIQVNGLGLGKQKGQIMNMPLML